MKRFAATVCSFTVCAFVLPCLFTMGQARGDTIHEAAKRGDVAALHHHLNTGADIDGLDEEQQYTPLMHAIYAGHTEAARLLIERGADITRLSGGNSSALAFAAVKGDVAIIRLLVERGADVNASVPPRLTPLAFAAAYGQLEAMQALLDLGAEVDVANQTGVTALHAAAHSDRIESMRWLMEQGADIHQRNARGFTALAAAAHGGHPEVVKLLLEHGARSGENNGDRSVVSLAAEAGHGDVVRLLLDRGAPVSTGLRYDSPLIRYAARHGDMELVRDLLERGAPMRRWNMGLEEAAEAGHVEAVQFLLEHDVRMSERKGENPFKKVIEQGHGEIVVLLLQARRKWREVEPRPEHEREDEIVMAAHRGEVERLEALLRSAPDADLYALEAAKRLAEIEGHIEASRLLVPALAAVEGQVKEQVALQEHLIKMAEQGDLREVRLALESGAEADWWEAGSGRNALYAAAGRGHIEIVKLLLGNGAEINANRGYLDRTAAGAAAAGGHAEVVRLLIDRGAHLDERSGRVRPIVLAAAGGHREVIEVLLESGVDVNERAAGAYNPGRPGATALMCAAELGHGETVELLLERGADPALRDDRGMTAQELALAGGHGEIAARLRGITGQAPQRVHVPVDGAIRGQRPIEEIRQMLDRGADANQLDMLYHRPILNTAVQVQGSSEYRLRLVRLLIDEGAKVPAVPGLLISALLYGADEPLVKLLIEHGADVNDRRGWRGGLSPLLVAVEKDNMPAVRLLIAQGADATVRRDDGRGVIELAAERSRDEIARLLAERERREARE
jgi:ankyrin repeat protein